MAGRVEITGQFNADNASCSNSQPFQIERLPSSIPTATIRNWNRFCDDVDEALAPLSKIKLLAKISTTLLYSVIAVYFLVVILLPQIVNDFDYPEQIFAFVIIPTILFYGIVYMCVRKGLFSGMEKVAGVCEQYSARDGGVKYALESEHWGGRNKRHLKKWYIVVNVDEEANGADDVEEQKESANKTASDYFSTQETSPDYFSTTAQQQTAPPMAVATPHYSTTAQETDFATADDAPTSRLADMLK